MSDVEIESVTLNVTVSPTSYDVSEVVLDADLEDFIALCVRYRLVEV